VQAIDVHGNPAMLDRLEQPGQPGAGWAAGIISRAQVREKVVNARKERAGAALVEKD
jgi:hypothetical protein